MTTEKNLCGKTRPIDNPYETWRGIGTFFGGNIEYRVLRKYQKPSLEAKNHNARWFVAGKSDMTHGTWECGDSYVRDIKAVSSKI